METQDSVTGYINSKSSLIWPSPADIVTISTFWEIKRVTFVCLISWSFTTDNLKDSVIDFVWGILLYFELIILLIEVSLEYRKYNKNLIERKFLIEKIKLKKIKKDELVSLQKLINERRNLKLVPFNNIHKFITIKMHNLMKINGSK